MLEWAMTVKNLGPKVFVATLLHLLLLNQVLAEPRLVVRNGHHRAIAIIALSKRGRIPRDTVVGKFEDQQVTAGELVDWYDAGKLLAYNESHSPSHVEEIIKNFDPLRAVLPSESNPAGGVILTKPIWNENLAPFQDMRVHGSMFKKPNCDDLMARLVGGKVREREMSTSTY